MRKFLTSILSLSMTLGLLCLCVSPLTYSATKSAPSTDSQAEAFGLRRLPNSVMAHAWVRPGIEFRDFHAVLVLPTSVSFRPEPRSLYDEYALSESQQRTVRNIVGAALESELKELPGLSITTSPGRHVLVLETALIDIVSHVPPEPAGRSATFVRHLGEATFVVELRDSMTHEVVARAIERRTIAASTVHRSNRAWTQSEVRRAADRLGVSLRRQVEEFSRRET